nr:gustatory receptor 3 sugar taste 64e [Monochamus saltuarius]
MKYERYSITKCFTMKYITKINVLPKHQKGKEYVPQTFHQSCKDLLTFAQCLGLFPLGEIRHSERRKLKFKWLSFRMLYSALLFVLILLCSVTSIYKAFNRGMVFYNLVSPLFNLHVACSLILFVIMSEKFPTFLSKIVTLDESFVKKYQSSTNMRRNIVVFAIIANIIVTVEHALQAVNFMLTSNCDNNSTGLEYYFKKHFHYIFEYLPYNTVFAFILLIANWIGAYIWNYGDVFIVAMSMILTARFHEIKNKIYAYTSTISTADTKMSKRLSNEMQKMDFIFWEEIRRDYIIMSELCRKLNDLISDVILFDFASNLTFILFQLFTGFSHKEKFAEMLYFYFSFAYVVLRICLLSIFGGWLYEAGRASLPMLNAVPTEIYNIEISRLIHQMTHNTPCFTGKNFFIVTKGLTLSVAAAIITYELVLIQFDSSINKSDHSICL